MPQPPEPASLRVRGHHDLSLHALEWSRTGRGLLFLHGFGHDAHVWDECAPPFAERFRVVALDARGHGESDVDPEYRYHHGSLARDVERVVESLDLAPCAIVAHSMSGHAAIRFAARAPERVTRLVLVEAGADLPRATGLGAIARPTPVYDRVEDFRADLARAHPQAPPATLDRLSHRWLRRRGDGRFEPRMDPVFLRPKSASDPENRRAFDRETWVRDQSERLWRELAQIACPTLVVRGERSPVLRPETVARMVRDALPDGRAATLAGCGHVPMIDDPEAFRATLERFLLERRGPRR